MANKVVHVPDEAWKCPGCGVGVEDGEGLVIDDDEALDMEFDHELYPSGLTLRCYACDWEGTVAAVARAWAKKDDQVPCPCCGIGRIPTKKAEQIKRALKKDKQKQ